MSLLNLLEEFIMFEKIRKTKNKKGFTLVELIVVLVILAILAILAALLVPALTGYIDKANNEKLIATTRQVVMAAQTEVSEQYGKDPSKLKATIAADTNPTLDEITTLAEVGKKGAYTNGVSSVSVTVDPSNGHVTKVIVVQGAKQCTYAEGSTVGDNAPYSVGDKE